MAPRVEINMARIAELRSYARGVGRGFIGVSAGELEELCALALTTFNGFGTSGADLDEELCTIDDMLERAGFDPTRGTSRALRKLVRMARLEPQKKTTRRSK